MLTIAGGHRRTLLLGGIGVLVLAAAGAAWYFIGQQEAPPPAPVARVQPLKPASKPASPAVAQAPLPQTPDAAIAEVIARSGLDGFAKSYRAATLQSIDASAQAGGKFDSADAQALREAAERALAEDKINNLLAGELKRSYDPTQFGRFIELLRQPINEKMTKLEAQAPQPEAVKQYMEGLKAKPPTQARRDLIQRVDLASGASEWAADMSVVAVRSIAEGALAASGQASKDALANVERAMGQVRRQMQEQVHGMLFYTYRDASDADLKQYAEMLESETGRWGTTMIANALRSVIQSTGRDLGNEIATAATARREAKQANKAATAVAEAPKKEAVPEPKPAAPVAKAAPKPRPAAGGYRRPPNLPVLYARYNDIVSAVWMGDLQAALQLLDDGKDPNARDKDGYTTLMIAAKRGDLDMARLLLLNGADANGARPGGPTPLVLAKNADNDDMVRLLQSHGATR
ncbi:MAG: ankyrin repeat domain-containing protein [Sphingomonadaceae bacterium]